MLKWCPGCAESKRLSDFYAHPNASDGRLGICKECHRRRMRKNRLANLDRIRAYDRARAKQSKTKSRIARLSAQWVAEHPDRRKAHQSVRYAVQSGRLKKPVQCQACGLTKRLHGHHHDYTKPLDVIWLCVPCHSRLHHEPKD